MKTLRKTIQVAVLVASVLCPVIQSLSFAEDATSPSMHSGKPAPVWNLKGLNGETISSAQFAGKVVVVDFWATWCPPCVQEIPSYIELQKMYAEKGLVIVGMSVDDDAATVAAFAKKTGINYTMLMADAKVQEDFGGIEAIPTTFVIDRAGQIRFSKKGYLARDLFEKQIKPLL